MSAAVRARVATAVGLGALACVVVATALTGAAAQAAGPVSTCHWIDREYDATYSCTNADDTVVPLQIVECWRYPASPRTYVRQKTSEGWIRNPLVTVKVVGNKGCASPYPYRTVVTVPQELLAEMAPTRVRLTMPAAEGLLPDGTEYRFGKTVVTYGACLMPVDAVDWCPQR